MRRIGQEGRREAARWVALALGLLLLVVMVHGVGLHRHSVGHSAVAGLFLLVPIFLFGAVDPMLSLWRTDWLGAAVVPAQPVPAGLFGRPPPLELF